jgi:hypothetical protein
MLIMITKLLSILFFYFTFLLQTTAHVTFHLSRGLCFPGSYLDVNYDY